MELENLIEPIAVVLSVYLAYRWGLAAYERQKEYDLIRERYLDGGIDEFAASVEHALGVFRHNWANALQVLKAFRDISLEEAGRLSSESAFRVVESEKMTVVAAHRATVLVNDHVFWEAQQLLFAFVQSANDFFMNDLGAFMRLAAAGKITISNPEEAYRVSFKRVQELDAESTKFYHLATALQNLGHALERKRFRLKNVDKFREDPTVKEIVSRLRGQFPAETVEQLLEPSHEEPPNPYEAPVRQRVDGP